MPLPVSRAAVVSLLIAIPAIGQEVPEDRPTPIASTRSGSIVTGAVPAPNLVRASARVDGVVSPGLRVTLDGSSSSGGRVWYRWLQTEGSRVAIDDPTKAEAHFTVPADASTLGFVLVVGNATGVDARAVSVEVDDPDRQGDGKILKADAGDDQAARAGRRVLLNGVRSEPRDKVRFRWIQTAGPKVAIRPGEGATATFVPTLPGAYQFALVVATAGGMISEPSNVTVTVVAASKVAVDEPTMEIDELARVALDSIDGGPELADELSKAFDAVADSINGHKTFAEAIDAVTRRLDAVVPRDRDRRAVWIDRLFAPLMARIAASLKGEGLDLTQAGAQSQALSRPQKARLAEQFRYTAAGLRATRTLR